ncbi:MAG: NAD(P)H-dependent oxidoreductase subunit E [Clostridia bacterium]
MDLQKVSHCCEMTTEEQFGLLEKTINDYGAEERNMIQILHIAQAIFGFLPEEVQKFVSVKMNLPLPKIKGVISFYSLFSTKPKGKHTISVCLGTACYVRGGEKVLSRIKEVLRIEVGETTEDKTFSLEVMRCIGACGLAPAISIDGKVYKRVNPNRVKDILEQYQ